jgi:deoxyribodipyrimidine photolyase
VYSYEVPGNRMTSTMRSVVWFRKGLRVHDNPALVAACAGRAGAHIDIARHDIPRTMNRRLLSSMAPCDMPSNAL